MWYILSIKENETIIILIDADTAFDKIKYQQNIMMNLMMNSNRPNKLTDNIILIEKKLSLSNGWGTKQACPLLLLLFNTVFLKNYFG